MKYDWQGSNSERFKKLSALDVLEWMEKTSQFYRKVMSKDDLVKIRELKEKNLQNVRRTK
ncbi:hypothetical protein HZC34_07535 [Candidatus Saganbacteria bacterium]|nr:hypothetical protein [Candidatus Saganbacteria bacterium]